MAAADGRNSTPRDLVPGFAKLIQKRREELGWSRHELAAKAGIGMTTLCCIEHEHRSPSLRVAMQLAQALGLETMLASPATLPKSGKSAKKSLFAR